MTALMTKDAHHIADFVALWNAHQGVFLAKDMEASDRSLIIAKLIPLSSEHFHYLKDHLERFIPNPCKTWIRRSIIVDLASVPFKTLQTIVAHADVLMTPDFDDEAMFRSVWSICDVKKSSPDQITSFAGAWKKHHHAFTNHDIRGAFLRAVLMVNLIEMSPEQITECATLWTKYRESLVTGAMNESDRFDVIQGFMGQSEERIQKFIAAWPKHLPLSLMFAAREGESQAMFMKAFIQVEPIVMETFSKYCFNIFSDTDYEPDYKKRWAALCDLFRLGSGQSIVDYVEKYFGNGPSDMTVCHFSV